MRSIVIAAAALALLCPLGHQSRPVPGGDRIDIEDGEAAVFANPQAQHRHASGLELDLLEFDLLVALAEHPQVVARRIEEAVAVVGERERVIASTDCGFGTFAGREWVAAPVVWKKLQALREGADIASALLWGRTRA